MSDYKKDFFRNKVFGSVEKLSGGGSGGRQFGSNDDDEEREEGDEAAGGKSIYSVHLGCEVLRL